ncbi:ABC-type nitrate/sulfonate/bicarbonate transport system permease component [Sediminihabitans luteus]|uniref:ABC-type nitrate/sulfonate/bicarbonate transport system permease component n=1 Tax=Sediminihabitans luteus TaxID=1138585 RepID=A0A2M9CYY1_9CELL|nr:ABC transporter permease subunit [Sediminihabitans luteus]PJJ77045.1 ABC-type nitrate/sulfonate/bicarbonate transport system permease component [Sediminihabitans luteus]GII99687.1 nitrate ABC transporter permease [Sediminihabitans luteus]
MSTTTATTAPRTSLADVALQRRRVRRQAARAVLVSLGRSLLTFAVTLVVVVAIWWGAIQLFDVSSYVAKGPADVWTWLVTDDDAAEHRASVAAPLGVTLGHAAIGFVAGLVVALLGAIVFRLSKGVEHALMPVAMLLRSVPLVAMAPVIIMIFGRDTATVAVIGGIVVLFPALVNIAYGLESASPQMNDVVAVYGGGPWTALRKVALPASLPSFFAAVRISVPGAITGALLAEWLATGDGVGAAISQAITQVQFSFLWSCVVAVTAVSLVLYNLVQTAENVVLARSGVVAGRA